MRYLITGITGFVGPHLAKLLLERGHEVIGLIRGSNGREADLLDVLTPDELAAIEFRYADLCDYGALQRAMIGRFDGIFHLAAQSHPPTSFEQPAATWAVNVQGSVNLIEMSRGARFMFCSTSEVYGTLGSLGPIAETETLAPINPYGCSKAAIDLYVQERVRNGYLDAFITRAFSHTGPRRGYKFSISSDAYRLARMILSGAPGGVLEVGNLETSRVVVDVRDVVRAYADLMAFGASGAYNIAGPQEQVREMAWFTDKLIELSGLEITKHVSPDLLRAVDIPVQVAQTARVEKAVNWEPTIKIEQTLAEMLTYWRRKLEQEKAPSATATT